MGSMRYGYKASAEQFTPAQLLDLVVEAERVGFDSAFISDHLQPWRHEGGHAPNALTWLGMAAERTRSIVLGTSVLTPTLRYHPAVIAQAFATLGQVHPGRFILGVGTGEALNEHAIGVAFPDGPERFARLREAVRLIRRLWTEDLVTFEGEHYSTDGATIYDKPHEPIPIYVAGGGPATTRYAGRVADGHICTSGKGDAYYLETIVPNLEEGIAKAERSDADVDRMIEIKVSYDRDPEQALEGTRFWAALSLTPEQKQSVHSPTEMQRLADELPIEQVAKRWIVSSDPEEAAAAIGHYVDLGFTHLVFHGPGHDQQRFLDQFAEDVLPLLKQKEA
ncbi:glucose-6-phosphate dehydrogenase (coenzyme-F420) [Agrococcus sp. SGAir0287]|uniref:glucose-6-phosphate dehydrogenase (coenzyme-F420) n=1 Tax=Agrococcus sp. SGAir0287 TaxID=2070347 RepID=UPI0010CCED53|nr:glucose-6-phosphate dehydrogenase (coenzyme-F420) [Agrococcus sp. SGAir0287]QCR20374.1 glucose-6-phosphate dehydrogenase (coenzyme-F420) [Agrococcus sp. SGAir0287]